MEPHGMHQELYGDARLLGAATGTQARVELRTEHLALFLAVLLAFLLCLQGSFLFDPDTYWHIAVGQRIWATGAFPWTDELSHTFAGAPWIAKEWLSQLVLYGAYALAGWSGVTVLTAAVAAASFTLLFAILVRQVRPTSAIIILLLVLLLSMNHFLAHPHVLAFPFLILWVQGLVRAVGRGAAPSWWLVPMLVVWENFHASYAIAFALAACFGLEALAAAPRGWRIRTALEWGAFGLASSIATGATPYGYEPVLIPLRFVGGIEAVAFIGEWQPLGLDITGVCAAFTLTAALGILLPRGGNAMRTIPVLMCGGLAFQHGRFATLFAVVAALAAAGPLVRRFPALAAHPLRVGAPLRNAVLAGTAALAAASFGLATLSDPQPHASITPSAALNAARRAGATGPVYNDYNFGGFLVSESVRTFVDGRTEQLFLGGFMRGMMEAEKSADDAAFLALLDHHHVTWALTRPDAGAAGKLGRAEGWREIYRDKVSVAFIKGG